MYLPQVQLWTHQTPLACGFREPNRSSEDTSSDGGKSSGSAIAGKSMKDLLKLAFCFKSEIVRDTAYENLTFSMRAKLHLKIVEWFEFTYSGDLLPVAQGLALHCKACGEMKKAMMYFNQASEFQLSRCNYTVCSRACHAIIDYIEPGLQAGESRLDISKESARLLLRTSYLRLGLASRALLHGDRTVPLVYLCELIGLAYV